MKKILFALAMLPLFAFVGCSSDDDNEKTPGNDFDIALKCFMENGPQQVLM